MHLKFVRKPLMHEGTSIPFFMDKVKCYNAYQDEVDGLEKLGKLRIVKKPNNKEFLFI